MNLQDKYKTKTFSTVFDDYKERNGQDFEIVKQLNKTELDEECGDMYKIKFTDGVIIDAYPEEIFEDCYFTDLSGNRLNE